MADDAGPRPTIDVWEFYRGQEPYISGNIQLADAKAGVVVLSTMGIFTFLFKEGGIHRILAAGFFGDHGGLHTTSAFAVFALSILTVVFLGLGAFFAFFTILPRVMSSSADEGDDVPLSVVSWPDVARHADRSSTASYQRVFRDLSKAQIEMQLLDSLQALASICRRKMTVLRRAFMLTGLGFITALLYLVASAPP